MTVLVLTRQFDPVADLVVTELNTRGAPVVRLDPGDLPTEGRFTASMAGPAGWAGVWRGRHRDLHLDAVTAVYCRRPLRPRAADGLPDDVRRWADAECQAGFRGVLDALPATWVNHPRANRAAASTPAALAEAARCGLRVPRAMVTNDPEAAQGFVASLPGAVAAYKSISTGGPVTRDGVTCASWTSKVHAGEITDAVSASAHYFSEWIDKAHEVRLTVVGERLFPVEIHAGSEASRIDFRRDYDALSYKTCQVPDTIAVGVRNLMRAFDLRYAALDFLVTHGGDWVLCDVNPNGQFGWDELQRRPITQALADILLGDAP